MGRAMQTEGREIRLVDTDSTLRDCDSVDGQVAIRGGKAFVPRLGRAELRGGGVEVNRKDKTYAERLFLGREKEITLNV